MTSSVKSRRRFARTNLSYSNQVAAQAWRDPASTAAYTFVVPTAVCAAAAFIAAAGAGATSTLCVAARLTTSGTICNLDLAGSDVDHTCSKVGWGGKSAPFQQVAQR